MPSVAKPQLLDVRVAAGVTFSLPGLIFDIVAQKVQEGSLEA